MSDNNKKANVLVIGNSGVGKSTLINAIAGNGKPIALIGRGEAKTNRIKLYPNESLQFNLIDTMGYEHDFWKQYKTISQIKKWSKNAAKNEDSNRQIDIIWYCIEATSERIFRANINKLSKSTKLWKGVPVIVVLTKSYSLDNDEENIRSVREAFAQSKYSVALKEIIPVVASTYSIDISNGNIREPRNLELLIEKTNSYIPEALQASSKAISEYKFKQKRIMSHSLVATATTGASTVGAVPIPIPDLPVISAIETFMIIGIGKIYGISISKDNKSGILSVLVQSGAVGVLGKSLANVLKVIPLAGSIVNAVIAGLIVAVLGETTIALMEAIKSGKISENNLNKIQEFVTDKINNSFIKVISEFAEKNKNNLSGKSAKEILVMLLDSFKKHN